MGYKDLCIIKCRVFIFNPGRKYPPCKMIPGFMTFLVCNRNYQSRLDSTTSYSKTRHNKTCLPHFGNMSRKQDKNQVRLCYLLVMYLFSLLCFYCIDCWDPVMFSVYIICPFMSNENNPGTMFFSWSSFRVLVHDTQHISHWGDTPLDS